MSVLACLHAMSARGDGTACYRITVVDSATGRGVPLVELRTTNDTRYFTDSNGNVAFDEAGLMNRKVFFTVTSHGYTYPKDSFGYPGLALDVKPGGSAIVKIDRINIAERLYRITGEGIYRDTLMLGLKAPTRDPLLNGSVMGQDTVEAARYNGKLYWFYGDTGRPGYPLGNFRTSGATSIPPDAGGLNPETGVDLTYFTDPSGFCKEMLPARDPGPIWVGGICTVRDSAGAEKLLCNFARMKSLEQVLQRGLAVFNDAKQLFEPVVDLDIVAPTCPIGHPFHALNNGVDTLYGALNDGVPIPCNRVAALLNRVKDPASYEAYSCLAQGTRYSGAETRLDRDASGKIRYAWKQRTEALGWKQQQELIKQGKIKPDEALIQLRDPKTGKSVAPATGSVYWNAYRNCWVMIVQEIGGTSLLGEVWYSEADTPTGPWVYAQKIITHDNYTFYNPTQHPFLDQFGGKRIYLEGTYTHTFSGNQDTTPRYDYNQIMYALSLDDPRLSLPHPIYRTHGGGTDEAYAAGEQIAAIRSLQRDLEIPFFAIPGNRVIDPPGLVPVYQVAVGRGISLQATAPNGLRTAPLFYGLAHQSGPSPSGVTIALYEYKSSVTGARLYETDPELRKAGYIRAADPICYVWRNPMSIAPLDWNTQPIPAKSR